VKCDDDLAAGSGISIGIFHSSTLLDRIASRRLHARLIDRESGRISLGYAAAGDADRHGALGPGETRPRDDRNNCKCYETGVAKYAAADGSMSFHGLPHYRRGDNIREPVWPQQEPSKYVSQSPVGVRDALPEN
jgi:hypothetical protein